MSSDKETKLCRHCKTEIPKDAKVCPNCRKKQSGAKKWVIIAVIVVLVIGIAGSGGDDDRKVEKVSSAVEDSEALDDRSGSKDKQNNEDKNESKTDKEQEKNTDEKKDDQEENDIFVVGDKVETSVFNISYLSAEKYTSDNQFIQPKDGHVYYKMEFEFENISTSDQYVSSYDFNCYADSYDMQQTWLEGLDLDATISPGKKTKGAVIFEVPVDSKEIILEYETDFWTQDKIVFAVK